MAPRRESALLGQRKPPVLAVAGRVRLGQADHAVFAVQIKPVVRENHRPFPHAAIAPRHHAGIELQRREDAAGKAVEVIADQHRRGVMVAHLARKVDLVGGGQIAGGADVEQRRAGAVIGRHEDAGAAHDRRRHVCGAVIRLVVGPQQPAVARIDGEGACIGEEDHLAEAAGAHQHRR